MQILRAAERLFAERGFDGASLREIAVAAKQGNNNAVQYHFGGKDRLIEAILSQRVAEMETERQTLLEKAEADDRLNDVGTLIAILTLPYLSLCDDHGQHPHARFLIHYMSRRLAGVPKRGFADVTAPAVLRLLGLLKQRIAALPEDISDNRIMLCILMFLNLLVQHDAAYPDGDAPEILARHVKDTIEAMTAALCGPYGMNR